MNVYLSHHVRDRSVAADLRRGLERSGLKVLDPLDPCHHGDDVFRIAASALRRARAMVLVISPDQVESPWFRHEWEYAITQLRFEGRVVPVIARPTQNVPWILNRLDPLDLEAGALLGGCKAAQRIKLPLRQRRRLLGS